MKKVLSFLMAFSLLFSTVSATETELNNEEIKNEVVTNEITEEVKATNEEVTENNQENDYKWSAIQPGTTTTSDGIKIDYEYKGTNNQNQHVFGLVYTIPEDYEKETITINPEIFEVIGWAQHNEEKKVPYILPTQTLIVNVTIINKSKYNYNYDKNSFVIYPYTADEQEAINYKRLDSDQKTFNNEDVTELQQFVRTDNVALRNLNLSRSEMSTENIDKALKEKGYKGFEELCKYYLDFFNDFYGYGKNGKNKVTKLSDFTPSEIANGIFGGFTTKYLEENAELIALHFDFTFNYGMGISLGDQKIDDSNQHEYSVGEYMRNESKGDDKIEENIGNLKSNDKKDIDMNFHFSGPLLTNAWQGYELTGHSHLSYTAAKGNLTVKYVDENGKELADTIYNSEMVGKEYTTEEKEFQYYELLKVEGNKTGIYTEEDTLVVYVYTYVGGTGGDDPDFPRTGIESNNIVEIISMLSLVALGTTILLKKKLM